jgi:hypothetical protein
MKHKLGPRRKFLHDDHFIEGVFPSDGPVDSAAHVAGDATSRHNSASSKPMWAKYSPTDRWQHE